MTKVLKAQNGKLLHYSVGGTSIKYGALYNPASMIGEKKIAKYGWRIMTTIDWYDLETYLIGGDWDNPIDSELKGGKLKETGTIYWENPNIGASNLYGFNARGGGYRDNTGVFTAINQISAFIWPDMIFIPEGECYGYTLLSNTSDSGFSSYYVSTKYGYSIRLIKETTILTHGQTGIYIGNDDTIYRTICINGKEYIADNLAETKFNDGTPIPLVEDNAEWAALTTPGMCYYDNDINNAFTVVPLYNRLLRKYEIS